MTDVSEPKNKMQAEIRTGGCLCGAIRYEAEGEPIVVAHCHCEDCQRTSGAGHSTGAMFPTDHFRLSGNVTEYKLTSALGNEVTKSFCAVCGSSLLGRNTAMQGFVTAALGTFDDASGFKPDVTVFARNKMPWDTVDEAIETWDDQPGWKPEDGI